MPTRSNTTSPVQARGTSSYVRRPLLRYVTRRPIVIISRAHIKAQIESLAANKSKQHHAHKLRRKMALLLPGHNEELIIATTIRSAIAAGQNRRDIFVVNDASTDDTSLIVTELLGKQNVLNVKRSGKALAVQKAIKKFHIERDYQWLHVADADSLFSPDYFRIYRKKLSSEYVVAIGFVQSLRGNWISTYRAFSYTYGQHVYRRIQAALGMISVFPGPVTSFRTDILSKLELTGNNVTEDFDITLQVHRKKLGKIVYIPKAINYTQDPQSFHDFCNQSMRWYTGFFQGIQEYRIGLGRQRIDIGIGFQLLQTAFFLVQVLVLFPIILIETHHWLAIPIAISIDFILTSVLTILSAIAIKRWTLIGVLPFFYFLRIAEIVMYFTAFIQIFALKRYTSGFKGWATEGRRYKIDRAALQDVA
jgi:biofilm PGA synthesis N-glycosyltransferase PgaC